MVTKSLLAFLPAISIFSHVFVASFRTTNASCSTENFHKQSKYKVGMLVYDEFTMLDLLGPGEVLGGYPEKFELHVIGTRPNGKTKAMVNAFKYFNTMSLSQANELHDNDAFDIIVIPGGTEGTQNFIKNPCLVNQVKQLGQRAKIVFSVCTGSLILAKAKLLNEKCATTNKAAYKRFTPEYSSVKWQPKARWVHDGKYLTSSGITAGMDAAFYLVSQLISRKEAERYATTLEYTPRWDSLDDPFADVYL